jgi:hypothetical protein
LADAVHRLNSPVTLWQVYHESEVVTSENSIQMAVRYLSGRLPNIPFSAGTNRSFAELNRNRPSYDPSILPCFSINPQVHAFDSTTLAENLQAQGCTVVSLRQFSRQSAVVSPITLRPRPVMGKIEPVGLEKKVLPDHVDVRQLSLFGAAWTLGSLACLTGTGCVHSLTYYEMTGWLGVMETETGSPMPNLFPSIPGGVFPLYHVFADLANCPRVIALQNSHPLQLQGMAAVDMSGRRRVMVANLGVHPQPFRLRTDARTAAVRYLDESNVELSQREPEAYRRQSAAVMPVVAQCLTLVLPPFALARLDLE